MNWRPQSFEDFIGQSHVTKHLAAEVSASKARDRPVGNCLFYGEPGLGKTQVCEVLAHERGVNLIKLMGTTTTLQSLTSLFVEGRLGNDELPLTGWQRVGNKWSKVPGQKTAPAIILIDEADALPRPLWEVLYYAFEPADKRGRIIKLKYQGQMHDIWVPPVTFVVATNYAGDLPPAIQSRCPITKQFQPYNTDELCQMISQYAQSQGLRLTDEALVMLASRACGIPRTAKQFVDHTCLKAVDGQVTELAAKQTFDLLGIDHEGLDTACRAYLKALHDQGGKASEKTLGVCIGEDPKTIRNVIEPRLIRKGFVTIGAGGRLLTATGRQHITQTDENVVSRLM